MFLKLSQINSEKRMKCAKEPQEYCKCDSRSIKKYISKYFGETYKPFFLYNINESSMALPDNFSKNIGDLYDVLLGFKNGEEKCAFPCVTTSVHSTLRLFFHVFF